MPRRINKKKNKRVARGDHGFALILVVMTGIILTIGAMIISARSINSLIRSGKQRQRNEATEIAEVGVSKILNELNSNFPYLLTVDCEVENNSNNEQFESPRCTGWSDFKLGQYGGPGSACSNREQNPSEIMSRLYSSTSSDNGYYRLRRYEFFGDQIQGGSAIIQVEGQRFKNSKSSSNLAASATIEQEVTITPKCCNQSPYLTSFSESSTSCGSGGGNYGLLADNLKLNGGNVLDWKGKQDPSQASVHCSGCKNDPEDSENDQIWEGVQYGDSRIDGKRSRGQEPNPDSVPSRQWDSAAWGNKQKWRLQSLGQTVNIGHNTHPQYCFTEPISPPITHCRMQTIQFSSGQLNIDPGAGDIRFYFDDWTSVFELSSNHFTNLGGDFGQIAFFGHMTQYNQCSPQKVAFSGKETIGPLFLHLPCATVDLAPGIEVIGTAIVDNWNAENNSNLLVPPNALQIMKQKYGISVSTNQTTEEFAAVGAKDWSLIQNERSTDE